MKYITLALRISPDREHVEIDATEDKADREYRKPCIIVPFGDALIVYVPEHESVQEWKEKLVAHALDNTDAEIEKLESIRAQLIRIREELKCHKK